MHRNGQVAEHVARGGLDDPIGDLQEALAVAPVEQAPDPLAQARFVDQPEQREEHHREDEGHGAERRDADVGDPARHLGHAARDLARVLRQRVERAAPAVDQAAQIALPGLVDDPWQVVAEVAHCIDDRLCHHQHDRPEDDHDYQQEHRGGQPPAPAEPPFHRAHHRREDGDAEEGDEEDEKHARDRRQRPRDGDGAGDQQDRPDRHRDLELGATRLPGPRRGLIRGHLLLVRSGVHDVLPSRRPAAAARRRRGPATGTYGGQEMWSVSFNLPTRSSRSAVSSALRFSRSARRASAALSPSGSDCVLPPQRAASSLASFLATIASSTADSASSIVTYA